MFVIDYIWLFYSDNQSSYRRPASERREHDNALLINYDGSNSCQYAKHGISALV